LSNFSWVAGPIFKDWALENITFHDVEAARPCQVFGERAQWQKENASQTEDNMRQRSNEKDRSLLVGPGTSSGRHYVSESLEQDDRQK
jgi:hypothetical protein